MTPLDQARLIARLEAVETAIARLEGAAPPGWLPLAEAAAADGVPLHTAKDLLKIKRSVRVPGTNGGESIVTLDQPAVRRVRINGEVLVLRGDLARALAEHIVEAA